MSCGILFVWVCAIICVCVCVCVSVCCTLLNVGWFVIKTNCSYVEYFEYFIYVRVVCWFHFLIENNAKKKNFHFYTNLKYPNVREWVHFFSKEPWCVVIRFVTILWVFFFLFFFSIWFVTWKEQKYAFKIYNEFQG